MYKASWASKGIVCQQLDSTDIKGRYQGLPDVVSGNMLPPVYKFGLRTKKGVYPDSFKLNCSFSGFTVIKISTLTSGFTIIK